MPLTLENDKVTAWTVRKIAVVGPGIVGMPMAAMLAHARIREGSTEPAKVVVVQRNSPTSGWKVDAINAGKSPIGGVEPDLDRVVKESVAAGLLSAAHGYDALSRRRHDPDLRADRQEGGCARLRPDVRGADGHRAGAAEAARRATCR